MREQLKEISIRTYVFCGKHDAQCPLKISEEIATKLRNAKLNVFEESNHMPFIEEKDDFLRMVKNFTNELF